MIIILILIPNDYNPQDNEIDGYNVNENRSEMGDNNDDDLD